jgi:hypothetical protein
MNRSRPSFSIAVPAAVAILLVAVLAVLAVVAGGAFGRNGPSGPPRSSPAVPSSPTARPSFVPVPTPSASVGPDFSSGIRVPIEAATGETRNVFVKDTTGMLVTAESGEPREDVSVGARKVVVKQAGDRSVRVVWADTAINDDVSLTVSRAGGTIAIEIVRRHLSPDIEIAHERVVVLTFDTGVNADGVTASIRNSIDTDD